MGSRRRCGIVMWKPECVVKARTRGGLMPGGVKSGATGIKGPIWCSVHSSDCMSSRGRSRAGIAKSGVYFVMFLAAVSNPAVDPG